MMMRDGLTKFRMEITHGEAAPLKTEFNMPECLRTDEAQNIFDKAKLYCLITDDYRWNTDGGFSQRDCAYFCANVSRELKLMGNDSRDKEPIKWDAFSFFGYNKINLSKMISEMEKGTKGLPKNAKRIDLVVPCHINVR